MIFFFNTDLLCLPAAARCCYQCFSRLQHYNLNAAVDNVPQCWHTDACDVLPSPKYSTCPYGNGSLTNATAFRGSDLILTSMGPYASSPAVSHHNYLC